MAKNTQNFNDVVFLEDDFINTRNGSDIVFYSYHASDDEVPDQMNMGFYIGGSGQEEADVSDAIVGDTVVISGAGDNGAAGDIFVINFENSADFQHYLQSMGWNDSSELDTFIANYDGSSNKQMDLSVIGINATIKDFEHLSYVIKEDAISPVINGFTIQGGDKADSFGYRVSNAGDINGDGFDDIAVVALQAAPNGLSNAGEGYVIFGGSAVGSSGVLSVSDLDGSNGFIIQGGAAGDFLGSGVSHAGDVNGDGIDDLIIGANFADPDGLSNAGESYVIFGGGAVGNGGVLNVSDLDGSNGFIIQGGAESDLLGSGVSNAGDVNGDGIHDLIVGAYGADPNNQSSAGESYVIFGGNAVGAGGVLSVSDLDGSNGFVIQGGAAGDLLGNGVSYAGDINGDGIDDLIVGAYGADPNNLSDAGESYVIFGSPAVGTSGVLDVNDLDGSNGFAIQGSDAYGLLGYSVSNAGDVNGDGIDDLIIGASSAAPNGLSGAGESYVIFGGSAVGSGGVLSVSDLDGSNGFTIQGSASGDLLGFSVSNAGDINGDGTDDLIIGAYGADPNNLAFAGESYVVFGGNALGADGVLNVDDLNGVNGFTIQGEDTLDYLGYSVSNAGDINGDGLDDLIIGARNVDSNNLGELSESYVIFGRADGQWGENGILDISLIGQEDWYSDAIV